jgi:hypothetical protein
LAEEKYAVWWLAADNGTIIYLVDNDTMKKESAHVKKESAHVKKESAFFSLS